MPQPAYFVVWVPSVLAARPLGRRRVLVTGGAGSVTAAAELTAAAPFLGRGVLFTGSALAATGSGARFRPAVRKATSASPSGAAADRAFRDAARVRDAADSGVSGASGVSA